jgi:hypothetical protein
VTATRLILNRYFRSLCAAQTFNSSNAAGLGAQYVRERIASYSQIKNSLLLGSNSNLNIGAPEGLNKNNLVIEIFSQFTLPFSFYVGMS